MRDPEDDLPPSWASRAEIAIIAGVMVAGMIGALVALARHLF